MQTRSITEAGGIVLVVAGFVTAAYLTQDVTFGFILPIIHVMNIAVGITGMGLLALMKPRLAPVAGAVGIGLAIDTFVFMYHDPLWALPALAGGTLCVGSLVSGRVSVPQPQQQ
ncbi:hypothetical protein ACFR9U_02450 [Halorientalis brevis]|uniref:SPW repeat-containing protein n=1 Tax=Halorientalis brevis TaxID=1126241 RepID=A0ABD6C8N1_9EURY|nr:hypothetical protein [Halorientalis brevis]